jgi:hypothetical protein
MPGLVGHTLTYVGNHKLVLVGGFSSQIYFSNTVYEYNAESNLINWQDYPPDKMYGAYPIGELIVCFFSSFFFYSIGELIGVDFLPHWSILLSVCLCVCFFLFVSLVLTVVQL